MRSALARSTAGGTPHEQLERLRGWFATRGWAPMAFQEEAWAAYLRGESGIVQVPTGAGKTYAAYLGPLAEVAARFAGLRCVVVDEWHELIDAKRGTQIELALSRLRAFATAPGGLRTWALTATVGNAAEAAQAVVGTHAVATVVRADIPRPVVIDSVDREERERVEAGLKSGALRLVVCTASLDLGVDLTPIERVVQIGSPKGIARLTQRAGRSGATAGPRSARIRSIAALRWRRATTCSSTPLRGGGCTRGSRRSSRCAWGGGCGPPSPSP